MRTPAPNTVAIATRLAWRAPLFMAAVFCATVLKAQNGDDITIHWDKVVRVSRTRATLQVVVNPPLRRGTPVHDAAFQALRDLHADYVRYVPWLPYPRLGVAELEPPSNGKACWDFSLIDPMTIDFLEATKGHPVILNFSTIPQWMYKTEKPVTYLEDPDQTFWDYEKGSELRDPTMKEVADYYARLFAWYTKGGFTDEFGKRHESGYHYSIPYWEVLNEPDLEHQMTPPTYTQLYDAVVDAIRAVEPKTKFVGMALALPSENPAFFEYFLNPKNHRKDIPLDYISYHFYAIPTADQKVEVLPFTAFTQADGFLNVVKYIEQIRKRLSPDTRTTIDEIGAISVDDFSQGDPGHVTQPIPNAYWNLSATVYAYLFAELTRLGIEAAGESQLVGYPSQFPSVTMVDWTNGKPNARFWALKLLKDNFGPGDKLVETDTSGNFSILAVVTPQGKRRVLLVNKRDRGLKVSVLGATGGKVEVVDQSTAFDPPASAQLESDNLTVKGLGIAVVTLP
jgi:Glycosyl hydrolases family 39